MTIEKRVAGRVALVTGAAGGIGQACAELLAKAGAAVLLTDLQEEAGEAVAAGIRDAGGNAFFLRQDVTSEDEWIKAIDVAKQKFGGLNILVNNAGIGRDAPITEMPLETWRLLSRVNLEGMFLGVKHSVPVIQNSPGGSIVNIASGSSNKATPNMSAYCASKAGVKMMTKVAALECARLPNPVRVNSVHPGPVLTPAWDRLGGLTGQDSNAPPTNLDDYARSIVPLGIMGKPSDIANAVLFLVSDEASFITGAELAVDGGRSAT